MQVDQIKQSYEMMLISKRMGKAIQDYDMLQDGDKVLVGVSGGKDSITLLNLLVFRQTFAPIHFDIKAVHVDADLPGASVKRLSQYFEENKFDYHIEKYDLLQGKTWEEMNCFWCSWSRRKVLFQLAEQLGYNKIALGHHMDDIVETILLNMFYRGEISGMNPKQELFDGKVAIIRPLAYERESYILNVAKKENIFELAQCACPRSDVSKRLMVKQMISKLENENPDIIKNIFSSIKNIKSDYLCKKGDRPLF